MVHQSMELLDRQAAGVEFPADFVQRRERVVAIEGRILDPLRRDRPADLLQLQGEMSPGFAIFLAERRRKLQQYH